MESIQTFLESSTIHGLSYISTTRRHKRLFWIIVVLTGFIAAGFIIYQSFQAWEESPVKTTIETRPITEVTFPNITVCPPKQTFTDLNYDLLMAENMSISNHTRNELVKYGLEQLYEQLYENLMTRLQSLDDNDRYYNWYHGYTRIFIPYQKSYGLQNYVLTTAASGTISTQYFGERFDVEKVEKLTDYKFIVSPHENAQHNANVTFHYEIQKISMEDLTNGKDSVSFYGRGAKVIDAEIRNIAKNYTPPGEKRSIALQRKVSLEDVKKQKLQVMPGLKVTWYYSGTYVESGSKLQDYSRLEIAKAYCRNGSSNNIHKWWYIVDI